MSYKRQCSPLYCCLDMSREPSCIACHIRVLLLCHLHNNDVPIFGSVYHGYLNHSCSLTAHELLLYLFVFHTCSTGASTTTKIHVLSKREQLGGWTSVTLSCWRYPSCDSMYCRSVSTVKKHKKVQHRFMNSSTYDPEIVDRTTCSSTSRGGVARHMVNRWRWDIFC